MDEKDRTGKGRKLKREARAGQKRREWKGG
jgi:hypothetical protein